MKGESTVTGAYTEDDGRYNIPAVEVGTYSLLISFPGAKPVTVNGIVVSAGENTYVEAIDIGLGSTEVVEVKAPAIERGVTQKVTFSGTDLVRIGAGGTGTLFSLVPGNVRGSIRGGRFSAQQTFVDGIRIVGNPQLPRAVYESYSVVTDAVPVEYGDFTSGITEIFTKGASNEFIYGGELSTSQFLDPYGNHLAALNATGPILYAPKYDKDGSLLRDSTGKVEKDRNNAKLGFIAAGQFNYVADSRPAFNGVYKAKDAVRKDLEATPLTISEAGPFNFVNRASFVTQDQLERVKRRPNDESWGVNFFGRLDYKLNQNTTINGGLTYQRSQGNSWNLGNSLYATAANPFTRSEDYRGFARFQQVYQPKDPNSTILKSIVYRVQADFSRRTDVTENPDFKDNYFKYGHIGRFTNTRAEAFEVINPGDSRHDPSIATGSYLQTSGYQDTAWVFDGSNSSNPLLANYNNFIYNYVGQNAREFPSARFFPGTEQGELRNNVFNSIDLDQLNGLNNGAAPSSIYGLFSAPGTPFWAYSRSQTDVFRMTGQAIFRLARKSIDSTRAKSETRKDSEKGYHNLKVGFEFDQRFSRSYSVNGAGLWGLLALLANRHIQNLDTANLQPLYDEDGAFTGRVHIDPLYSPGLQSTFDRNLRLKLGLDPNGVDYVNPQQYGPDFYSLDMFSLDELFSQNVRVVSYRGYDYLGERTGQTAREDFFTDTKNRPIPAYAPTYAAGYIEDRFELDNINIRLGLRIDRFDNNIPVLKDKFLLVPAYNAGDAKALGGFELPGNVQDDWVPYLSREIRNGERITNPSEIIGYRDGSNWYDENGAPVNPRLLQAAGGRVQPYIKTDSISFDAFEDYKPRVKALPRISFSFPITDRANFNASYDVLSQRPEAGNVADFSDYLFLQANAGGILNNPDLGLATTISYYLGFSQALDEQGTTALSINGFYREMRDMVQVVRNLNAYPITYDSFENIDFGTVKGLTFAFNANNLGMLRLRASYTLQFAEGTGSGVGSSSRALNNISGFTVLRNQLPLSFDQRHTINGYFAFDFNKAKFAGPHIRDFYPLKNLYISLNYNLGSGAPYTQNALPNPADVQAGVGEVFQTEGQPFGARLPFLANFDLQLRRQFTLKLLEKQTFGAGHPREGELRRRARTLKMEWYIVFVNVLNLRNILGVYAFSGQPDDSGYLQTSFGRALINSQIDPQAFVDQYRVREKDPGNFSSPRQIRLGCQFEF